MMFLLKKLTLSSNDDKRMQSIDSIEKIKRNNIIKQYKNN